MKDAFFDDNYSTPNPTDKVPISSSPYSGVFATIARLSLLLNDAFNIFLAVYSYWYTTFASLKSLYLMLKVA